MFKITDTTTNANDYRPHLRVLCLKLCSAISSVL